MNDKEKGHSSDLDPWVAESIKEIATIQARLAALEIYNSDIKPEIKDLAKPKWGIIGTVITTFFLLMGLLIGLQHNSQVADYDANAIGIKHTEEHLKGLEGKVGSLRDYIDRRDDDMRSIVMTKKEHEIFDKERTEKLQEVTRRIEFLEHRNRK